MMSTISRLSCLEPELPVEEDRLNTLVCSPGAFIRQCKQTIIKLRGTAEHRFSFLFGENHTPLVRKSLPAIPKSFCHTWMSRPI